MGRSRVAPMNRYFLVGCLAVTVLCGQSGRAATYGEFIGDVISKWLDDGRLMELTEDFSYVDPGGRRWSAPKGSKVDGASIPRVLWTAIGGPFEGQYRKASVLHDVACALKKDPWEQVHRMFYDAMLCAGVGQTRALAMYGVVHKFGPRWNEKPKRGLGRIFGDLGSILGGARSIDPTLSPPPPEAPDDVLQQFERQIEEQKITTPEAVITVLGG